MLGWTSSPYDLSNDETRVCYRHGRVNVCRAQDSAGCLWRTDAQTVDAVQGYQENRYDTWQIGEEWYPGMPCNHCYSRHTWWEPGEGATCGSCGSTDMDE
jgi:hypothetical protein